MTDNPPERSVEDLIRRLNIKADIISTGERIQWGSDSAIMREAAEALEAERQKREEVVEEVTDWMSGILSGSAYDDATGKVWKHWLDEGNRILEKLTQRNRILAKLTQPTPPDRFCPYCDVHDNCSMHPLENKD